jgi:L-asparaginase
MQSLQRTIVILGTGGTIAGRAHSAQDNVGYRSGEVGVGALVQAVPALHGRAIEAEQVAQIDSKDMDPDTWQALARRTAHHLAREDVAGVVVTHGTDTLEETAWLLHRVLAPSKPLVLTAAMRPSTSLQADGPQNLLDAVTVASDPGASGVVVVFAGKVHAAIDVQKQHSYRVDAFGSGDAGPIGVVQEGRLRLWRGWPAAQPLGLDHIAAPASAWPWVDIVTSTAASSARGVDAWVQAGIRGIVVAGTGNGTVHRALIAALQRAAAAGVRLRRCTRCAWGPVIGGERWLPVCEGLNAPKARIELMLELMRERPGA